MSNHIKLGWQASKRWLLLELFACHSRRDTFDTSISKPESWNQGREMTQTTLEWVKKQQFHLFSNLFWHCRMSARITSQAWVPTWGLKLPGQCLMSGYVPSLGIPGTRQHGEGERNIVSSCYGNRSSTPNPCCHDQVRSLLDVASQLNHRRGACSPVCQLAATIPSPLTLPC